MIIRCDARDRLDRAGVTGTPGRWWQVAGPTRTPGTPRPPCPVPASGMLGETPPALGCRFPLSRIDLGRAQRPYPVSDYPPASRSVLGRHGKALPLAVPCPTAPARPRPTSPPDAPATGGVPRLADPLPLTWHCVQGW